MRQHHGLTKTRIYRIWSHMKRRCNNPNHQTYHRYGGRGIKVCNEWQNDFMSFYEWSTKNGYEDNLTIDRIDNDGNYEPSNCRWATAKQQKNNRGDFNINITYDGRTQTLMQWAEETGIPFATLRYRIVESNWPIEDVFKIGIGELYKNSHRKPIEIQCKKREEINAQKREKYHQNRIQILKLKEQKRREKGVVSREEYEEKRLEEQQNKKKIIQKFMNENPSYSLRQLEKITGIPRTTIHRILKDIKFT